MKQSKENRLFLKSKNAVNGLGLPCNSERHGNTEHCEVCCDFPVVTCPSHIL